VLTLEPGNKAAHYYIGRVLAKGAENDKSKQRDAILHLQQGIQSEDPTLVSNSLYQISKLLVQ
jgi:hypothetical protein